MDRECDACRLLQPNCDARAHPASVSILTREWSSRSATRRHQPMPVALVRGASPHRGPVSHFLLTSAYARRVPLAWTRQEASRDRSRKVRRAFFRRYRAFPSRDVSDTRVAGATSDEAWTVSSHVTPAKTLLGCAPRRATPLKESGCLLPKENPYASGRWLLRARPNRWICHAASWGGIARELSCLSCLTRSALF